MQIADKYAPQQIESKWYDYWIEQHIFHSEPDQREPYTIVIPPPNVTGMLHMGHMLNNTLQDVLIRRARMSGKNACWVPGMDHASIATEAKVVAMLHEKGIEHRDFNHGNILWDRTPAGAYRFQLIDINRMHFDDRPLSSRACMINLRRLSCPAVAFLYILDRYAETRGWDVDDTLLRGTFFRLAFGRRKQLRKRFRHRKG
mgnify:CR=1 FL=1